MFDPGYYTNYIYDGDIWKSQMFVDLKIEHVHFY